MNSREALELQRQMGEFGQLWNGAEAILRAVPDQIAADVRNAKAEIEGAAAEAVARIRLAGGSPGAEEPLTPDQHRALIVAVHGAIDTIVSVAAQLGHRGEALDQRALLATVVGPVVSHVLDLRPAQHRQAFIALTGVFLAGMIDVEAARVRAIKADGARSES